MNAVRLLLVVAMLSNLSFAENTQTMSASASDSSELPSSRLAIAPAIALVDGETTYGFNTDIGFKVGIPLYVGLVTGLYTKSESGVISVPSSGNNNSTKVDASARVSLIPIMASAVYEFQASDVVRPYVGLGAGISLALASVSASVGGRNASISDSDVFFMGVARAGVDFALSKSFSLYAEPRAGIIDGNFLFNPQVGVAFGL